MKRISIYLRYFIYLVMIAIIMTGIVSAGRINPVIGYCEGLGYNYQYNTSSGIGECIMPNNVSVMALEFLLGGVAQEYSYCSQNNLEIKIVSDTSVCMELGIETCAVCKFPDGTEIEVTKAMELDLITGYCGDQICDIGETYENCQKDCFSGTIDGYCDKINDGICDEDCILQQIPASDMDCPYCGDGKCEEDETYENCQADCPSGFKDNFCDNLLDFRCDPDCTNNSDLDCVCGDKICQDFESIDTCSRDCMNFWQRILFYIKSIFS